MVYFVIVSHPIMKTTSPGRKIRLRYLKLDLEIHSTEKLMLKLTKYDGDQQRYSIKYDSPLKTYLFKQEIVISSLKQD